MKKVRITVNQWIDYILRNLHETLTVKEVAERFHYSEFHFNRIFKAETGEPVHAFIKRLKMDQSAIDVKLKPGRSITDIGLDYGYTSSNYSSAFKKHHAASPAQFRKASHADAIADPFSPAKIDVLGSYEAYAAKIKLEVLPDLPVLCERMIGDYSDIKKTWVKFIADHKSELRPGALLIERFYDDPSITAKHRCICDFCISVDQNSGQSNVTTIKGGMFAIYRYEGKIADIFCAIQGIFSVWLANSSYEMAERYAFNLYRNIDLDHDFVVMDLCIPIQSGRNSEVLRSDLVYHESVSAGEGSRGP